MTEEENCQMWDFVVVVVTWNVKALVQGCLDSLFDDRSAPSFKAVVVDNASSDGTAAWVTQNYPAVDTISNGLNLGFSAANNQAISKYRGQARYFVLLNPDTLVQPDALRRMLCFLNSHPEAGIVGGKVVKPDGALDWPCKRSFQTPEVFFCRALALDRLFPWSRRFGRHHLTYLDENQTHEVDAVTGAFLAIRGETVDQIGLLDEELKLYSEDMDWCHRAKNAGWKVFYYPEASVIHLKSSSSKQNTGFALYWWYRSTWMVYRRYMAPRYPWPVNALIYGGLKGLYGLSILRQWAGRGGRLPSRR